MPHSQLRNKSLIPDAAGENNLSFTPATGNTHDDEAGTSSNCTHHLGTTPNSSSLVMLITNQPECNAISTAYRTIS